jgi:hypothetical protein
MPGDDGGLPAHSRFPVLCSPVWLRLGSTPLASSKPWTWNQTCTSADAQAPSSSNLLSADGGQR